MWTNKNHFTLHSISEMNQAFSAFMSIPPEVIENNILKYLTCEDVRSFALFGSLIGNKKLHDIAFRVEKNRSKFKWNPVQNNNSFVQ